MRKYLSILSFLLLACGASGVKAQEPAYEQALRESIGRYLYKIYVEDADATAQLQNWKQRKELVAEVLTYPDTRALIAAAHSLDDPETLVQSETLGYMGQFFRRFPTVAVPESLVQRLHQILISPQQNRWVRLGAADALSIRQDPQALESILAILQSDTDELALDNRLVRCLQPYQDSRSVSVVLGLMPKWEAKFHDPEAWERKTLIWEAIHLFNSISSPEVFPVVSSYATNPAEGVSIRIQAINILGGLRDRGVLDALLGILESPTENNEVKESAAHAVRNIVGDVADRDTTIRILILFVAEQSNWIKREELRLTLVKVGFLKPEDKYISCEEWQKR